jgi:FkbM family methyltransferase
LRDIKLSYSQAGEDLILDCIFNKIAKGAYVDVGANHPIRASNTYLFYKKGWRGINIDALPDAIKMFKKQRNKDINIEVGVSDVETTLDFYSFKLSSYNTFNKELVDELKTVTQLLGVKKVPVKTLSSILNQQEIKSIDFMSVDVEGLDLNVLKSNDWEKFHPKVVLVEDFNHGIEIIQSPIYQYMSSIGYKYFCQTCTNVFYIDIDFYKQRFVH